MNEAVELLSRYLQIDTTNPPGNEDQGVKFFAEIFEAEKVDYKIYDAAPGRQSIRAVIPGAGQKGALILLNHIDVVPARLQDRRRVGPQRPGINKALDICAMSRLEELRVFHLGCLFGGGDGADQQGLSHEFHQHSTHCIVGHPKTDLMISILHRPRHIDRCS